MNPKRRAELQRLVSEIAGVTRTLTDMYEEEEQAFESLPRSVQEGPKGKALRTSNDMLFAFTSAVHTAVEEIQGSKLGVRLR